MTRVRLVYVYFVCVFSLKLCQGITNIQEDQKNLIGEEERRGVNIGKVNIKNDQKKAATTNRELWVIAEPNRHHNSAGHGSAGFDDGGYHEHSSGAGAYGISNNGYDFDTSEPNADGYHYKRPHYGSGYGHGVPNYDPVHTAPGSGSGYGQIGTEVIYEHGGGGGHGDSAHSAIKQKLALKKILIPLAGLALIGAVAALSTNPILLQLGTINGRRRRRSIVKRRDVYPAFPTI